MAQPNGDFELVVHDRRDPDRVRHPIRPDEEAAEALAQIMGRPRITQRLSTMTVRATSEEA